MIKNERGVTILVLTIVVTIILIITGMLVYSANDGIYIKNLTNLQNDISNLRDKISLYYSEYGTIPASTQYTNLGTIESENILGANDGDTFFIIELELLDGLTLNYGKDYEKYKNNQTIDQSELKDIYIINEQSHNIFYVQGVGVEENGQTTMYYTDYTEGDKEAVEIVGVPEQEEPQFPIPTGFYYVGGTEEKGIVISDDPNDENRYADSETVGTDLAGNQYVWIPVDGILDEDGTIEDVTGEEKKILLGRYSFESNGTPSKYESTTFLEETPEEHTQSNYENAVALNIENFKQSVKENGGYYIARFEASQGTNNKVESKYDQKVWNGITQSQASSACQGLYTEMVSDLTNSYAWDTAILFMQKNSTDPDYSRQIALQTSIANTGRATNGTYYDVRCNIYDLSGNCFEWSTETSANQDGPGVSRGGVYSNTSVYTCHRFGGCGVNLTADNTSFRPILYYPVAM